MSFKANLVKWFMHTLRRCWPRWSTCWTTKAIEIAWLCLGLDQQGFWFGSIANIQGTILIWFDLLGTQANPGYEVSLNGYVCASRQTRCVGTNSEILGLLWLPARLRLVKQLTGSSLSSYFLCHINIVRATTLTNWKTYSLACLARNPVSNPMARLQSTGVLWIVSKVDRWFIGAGVLWHNVSRQSYWGRQLWRKVGGFAHI